ncbi:MAG: hypothetical protein QM658_01475 [Gordonia sp. (in: high G+C Gram-positive bacteria)]
MSRHEPVRHALRRALCGLLVVGALAAATACGSTAPDPVPQAGISETPLGDAMRAYHENRAQFTGIAVWFHGMDSPRGTEIQGALNQRRFVDPFLRAGWVVASADAGGNSFANPGSLRTYLGLIRAVRARFGEQLPLAFLSESMGSLAALKLYARPEFRSIRGMVGVSPLTGLPPEVRAVDYVRDPWGGEVPASADPLTKPAGTYAGRRFFFVYSPEDRLIPLDAGARAFTLRFDPPSDVDLNQCSGDHGDESCYLGPQALAFIQKEPT